MCVYPTLAQRRTGCEATEPTAGDGNLHVVGMLAAAALTELTRTTMIASMTNSRADAQSKGVATLENAPY